MNLIELQRALRQLRLGGIAAVLETRLHQAQSERMAPIDLISCLVSNELNRRSDLLLERCRKAAQFRDPQKSLDNLDFNFNKKMNRSLVFDLATAGFAGKHEDALFLGPLSTGKSHLALRYLGTLPEVLLLLISGRVRVPLAPIETVDSRIPSFQTT
jgi:DNA replication protein DnaC